ncbi:MAG: NUDIX domain-containing protein [Thermoplasmata archaeon]
MTTSREFCRFAPSREPIPLVTVWASPRRACLSVFLLLTPAEHPTHVLAGKIDPRADWEEIGALSAPMVEANRERWILPSSHLIIGEGPTAAAARILAEQLGGFPADLAPPLVIHDTYPQRGVPEAPPHWDIGFVFRGRVDPARLPATTAFRELRFLDLPAVERAQFGRMHDEVLEEAGFSWTPGR